MRWLKSLVIVLAALIVVALGLLGYGFVKRTSDPEWRLFAQPPAAKPKPAAPAAPKPAAAKPEAKPWGEINLGLAAGCRVSSMRPEGDRLYLTIGPDGACARIVIIDTVAGRVLGTIRTGP